MASHRSFTWQPTYAASRFRNISLGFGMWVAGMCCASLAFGQPSPPLELHETADKIVVHQHKQVVVTYNKQSPAVPAGIDPIYRRSGCLHPVRTPKGRTVTEMFPFDHPHQHGIFSAWVKTTYAGKPIDFWNLAGGTGRVLHERTAKTFQTPTTAGFAVDLLHRAETEPPVDVLRERWEITVHAVDDANLRGTNQRYHCFDLTTEQRALTDTPLIVSKHHYGGIVLRGPTRWLTEKDRGNAPSGAPPRETSDFLNNLGSNRQQGNHQHAKWVALWGNIDGAPVSIAVLSHRDNFRAPQAARLHPTKPYFCFAPCVDGAFTIDRKHPWASKYRYLITDAKPDATWLDAQWTDWCGKE